MNILFVSSGFQLFDKLDCGASIRSTMFLEAMCHIGSVDVISFYKNEVKSNIDNCQVVGCYPIEKKIEELTFSKKMSDLYRLLTNPLSPYTYYLKNDDMERIVDTQLSKKEYDIICCRYLEEAVNAGLLKYSDKLVIDIDDNLVCAYLRDIPKMYFKNIFTKGIAYYKAYAIGFMTKYVLKNVKVAFYSNLAESPCKKALYLPNVTIVNSQIDDVTDDTPMRILIVGWLDFHPNKDGVLHFVRKVFPQIKRDIPNVEVHIVGKSKDKTLLDTLNAIDGVVAKGFVENIVDEYKNCRLVVVPIYSGAGTSVKFVEAIMMNRPVIATKQGVRGLGNDFESGVNYIEVNNDEDFAKSVTNIIVSIPKLKEMAKQAKIIGNRNYSKERFIEIVKTEVISKFPQK